MRSLENKIEFPQPSESFVERVCREGQLYAKVALGKARVLTQQDFREREGKVRTPQGVVSFQPGDYLAVGDGDEEWPITQEEMRRMKRPVGEPDPQGFSLYETTLTVWAFQVTQPIQAPLASGDVLRGSAGDYVVSDGRSVWVAGRDAFEQTYDNLTKRVRGEGQQYIKTGLTRARRLSSEDVERMGGIIQTLEGPVKVMPGDYLAIGVSGETWRIEPAFMERTKQFIKTDNEGFGLYKTTQPIRAIEIDREFRVRFADGSIIIGKPGDFLVDDDESAWIVDRAIFFKTYDEWTSNQDVG